ncbi:MAG TPA: tRNA pseudouridine(38-40) synthase TruA [Syntrophorhabdaceae bacterium]|nr:tRNA pseudouridine(38-40) synthase TruA [Syntrophorhabdaceae bacterium]
MRNIKLTISYDGTNYHGWQCQPDRKTIQETIKKAIERIVNHEVKVFGGARTDSGVHAMGQVANFFTEKTIDLLSLKKGLNSLLPKDIRVLDAKDVDNDFHARYSAKSKTYVYIILNTPFDSPFFHYYTWHVPYYLDTEIMHKAIKEIVGVHDFSAFKKKNEIYKSNIREVLRAGVKRRKDFIYILIEATGFLRYMVRNITGTLILIGKGKINANAMKDILESKNRDMAGQTAPAKGLFLKKIVY